MITFKILPPVEEVLLKVKHSEGLTPWEHYVYLLHVEELSERDAKDVVEEIHDSSMGHCV